MGYEDRDWFREDYAKKQGLIYDKATGRYKPASRLVQVYRQVVMRFFKPRATPFLTVAIWVGVCFLSYFAYKILRM